MAELKGIDKLFEAIEKKVKDAIPVWAEKIKETQSIQIQEKQEEVEVAVKDVTYDKDTIHILLNRSYKVSEEYKLEDGNTISNPNRQNVEGVIKRGGALSDKLGHYGIIKGIGESISSK